MFKQIGRALSRKPIHHFVPYKAIQSSGFSQMIQDGVPHRTTLSISLEGDKLQELYSTKSDEEMEDVYKLSLTEHINMRCRVTGNESMVKLTMIPENVDPNIEYFVVHLEGKCEEIPWSTRKYTTTECLYDIDERFARAPIFINHDLCKNKDKLTLSVDAELICIKYKSQEEIKYFGHSPMFDSHMEIEWILEGEELDNFKDCMSNRKRIYSPNFLNDCIGMYCHFEDPHLPLPYVGVEFYRIPHGISAIEAALKLIVTIDGSAVDMEINEFEGINDDGSVEKIKDDRDYETLIWKYDRRALFFVGDTSKFENVEETLGLKVVIDIRKVWIIQDIMRDQWKNYGIK